MKEKILSKLQLFIIPVCFGIYTLLSLAFCKLYVGSISSTAIIFSVLWAMMLTGIVLILPSIVQRIWIILSITISALTCILHAVMYNLFGHFFSFADLLYTEDGMAFFSFSYLKVRKLLWIVVIGSIVMSFVLAIFLQKKKYSFMKAGVGVVMILLAVFGINMQHDKIMSNINTTMAWDVTVQGKSDANAYQTMSDRNRAMAVSGIYQYLYRNFMVSSGLENKMDNGAMYEELDSYFADMSEEVHESNEMTGVFQGKNVFFIMLESIDTWMLTEEYMPNLYSVQQDSINFVNHFSPLYISAGTFNTEFIANTGLIPPTAGVDTNVYVENAFPYSLANCFANEGYFTNSFHSSNPNIYNRGAIHENLGYTKYHNWVDMNMENYMLDSQMINGYSEMVQDTPFFSFIITYSGHGPYSEEMQVISETHIDLAKTLVKEAGIEADASDLEEYTYAIAHAMETDAFIGELMQQLETDGLLEDTVLIFFTDHYGKYMTNHDFIKELKQVENSDFIYNTPFFIYSKGAEPKTIDTVTSSVDIAPTVANLFQLDTDYKYYLGVDAFSDADHYVIFPGNNWYDGETYYSAHYQGEMTEMIASRNQEIIDKIKYSGYILKSDYFSYLNNE